MKQTVDYNSFRQAFADYDRLRNFPRGLRALFDYLEDYKNDTGEEMELDVIALCCDFTEYDIEELPREFAHLIGDEPDDQPKDIEEWAELLADYTTVIPVDDETLIVQAF